MNDISKLKYIVDRLKHIERSLDQIKIELMDFFLEVQYEKQKIEENKTH